MVLNAPAGPNGLPPLRPGVVSVRVDDETLLLDVAASRATRLDAAATAALEEAGEQREDVVAALIELDLVAGSTGAEPPVARRRVLRTGGLVALGISVVALPSAATAASPGALGGEDEFALATGAVASFAPSSNSNIDAIAVQSDGRIVIGGAFSNVGGVTRSRIARLHQNGVVDDTFNPSASNRVRALAIQSDGRIVLGGDFTLIGGVERRYLARVDVSGSLDPLSINLSGNVRALAVQPNADGLGGEGVVVGGAFVNVGATVVRRLIRVAPNGGLDTAWVNIGPSFDVYALTVDASGRVVVGGAFQTFFTESSVVLSNTAGVVRVTRDGAYDNTFTSLVTNGVPFNNAVNAVAVDGSGRVLLGGSFQTQFVGGTAARYLARVNADGTPDTTFVPNLDSFVNAIVVQTDGKAVIGGQFTSVDGLTRNRIARLHADPAPPDGLLVDTTFDPDANGIVSALALQTNGRILLGGAFTTVGGQARARIARLD